MYAQGITPKEAYPHFADKVGSQGFGDAYRGDTFRLIRPEVFTAENKHQILSRSKSGAANGRAKLTEEDVKTIRSLADSGVSWVEIYKKFPQVTRESIRNIIHKITWKNV